MQQDLFTHKNANLNCATGVVDYIEHRLNRSWLREYKLLFSEQLSSQYLHALINTLPWQRAEITIAGRRIPVPRLQCWMGDAQSQYSYSGMRLTPLPWTEQLLAIKTRVETVSGYHFNSVLLNYYRDGKDSVAWHSDDEPELGKDPVIASLSFGAQRLFELRPIRHKHGEQEIQEKKFKLLLDNGSLLLMGGQLQGLYQHQLPKQATLSLPRLNLTFRSILGC